MEQVGEQLCGTLRLTNMRTKPMALFVVALLATSCGEPSTPPQSSGPRSSGGSTSPTPLSEPSSPAPDQLYEGGGLVLDEGDGPVLCVGGVNDSLPPQCGGPKIQGWDWAGLQYDRAGSVRWGEFTLRGTYQKGVFTLRGKPAPFIPYESPAGYDTMGVPCEEPEGGWPMPDPELTSSENLQAAISAAEAQPDSAGAWIDYLVEPTDESEMEAEGTNIVLTLAFTGDAERRESETRENWGGALCIWIHERTQRELGEIQSALGDPWIKEMGIETTWSDRDVTTGIVSVGVIVSTPAFEAELARRYGAGVVKVVPALVPVE